MDEIPSKCFEKSGDAPTWGRFDLYPFGLFANRQPRQLSKLSPSCTYRVRLFILNHNIAPINKHGRNNIEGPVYF